MTALTSPIRFAAGATMFVLAASVVVRAAERPVATDVFVSGSEGYHTFRIPSLIASAEGTLLAFCEGRKSSRSDHGDIDLVLRRSSDGGKTWGPIILVYEEGGPDAVTIGNPCPVVDASTGTIWLPFCRDNDTVLVTSSSDDGRRWSAPREITQQVKRPDWGWYATGPGVGIQLRRGEHAGRLVIPCDHRETVEGDEVMFSHVFYSDDNGQSWKLGGSVDRHTDECQVVELSGGELLINMRNYWERTGIRPERGGKRAVARSSDGGVTWSGLDFDAALIEPICQASLIAVPHRENPGSVVLVFSNPANKKQRQEMTVRVSFDEGRTWPQSVLIDEGSAAYSCLAPLADGRIGLLYERDDYGRIVFTTLSLDANDMLGSAAEPSTR
jgi:sialidase-1